MIHRTAPFSKLATAKDHSIGAAITTRTKIINAQTVPLAKKILPTKSEKESSSAVKRVTTLSNVVAAEMIANAEIVTKATVIEPNSVGELMKVIVNAKKVLPIAVIAVAAAVTVLFLTMILPLNRRRGVGEATATKKVKKIILKDPTDYSLNFFF